MQDPQKQHEQIEIVKSLTHLMRRRGPDDYGYWNDIHCSFGFRRLSILDLSPAGHQPMLSSCKNYVLLFNGEVYNFIEIRDELISHGKHFKSKSDTEVVLEALVYWGKEALKRFNGMFALALYNTQTHHLLLARDPLGIKPLYYLLHPNGLVFGSQYDQICRHPWCDRSRINYDVLGLYLRLGYIPAPYALFTNTYQLKPGSYLCYFPDGRLHESSYYQLNNTIDRSLTGDKLSITITETLKNAVKRQMISDVPIGVFLSGGVDSSLVAATMQSLSNAPVTSLTIGMNDARFDETATARDYADHLRLNHVVRMFEEKDVLNCIGDFSEAFSEPFADSSALPSLLVTQFAKKHVTVALSGDGGDELFWGYPRFQKTIDSLKYFRFPLWLRYIIYTASRLLGNKNIPQGIIFATLGQWYFNGHSGLNQNDLLYIAPELVSIPDSFTGYALNTVPSEEELGLWMRAEEIKVHLPMMLMKMDRASMYNSLEVRVPLLDLELVELALQIPPKECITNTIGKTPLRNALQQFIPKDKIPVKKKGFDIPLDKWLSGILRPLVEGLLLERDPYPNGFFIRKGLERLYRSHLLGQNRSRGIWNLLALQLWAEKHLHPLKPTIE